MGLTKVYGVPKTWVPPEGNNPGYWEPAHQVRVELTPAEIAQREWDATHAEEKKALREAQELANEALKKEVRTFLLAGGVSPEAIAAWEGS